MLHIHAHKINLVVRLSHPLSPTFGVQSYPSEVPAEFPGYVGLAPGWQADQGNADLGVDHGRPRRRCRGKTRVKKLADF